MSVNQLGVGVCPVGLYYHSYVCVRVLVYFHCWLGAFGEGHPEMFNPYCFCILQFHLLVFQFFYTVTSGYFHHRWYLKGSCGGRLGTCRFALLFVRECVCCCNVWSVELVGRALSSQGCAVLCCVHWGRKAPMQILPFTKWHSAYTVQMGNRLTNTSCSWMQHRETLATQTHTHTANFRT